MSTCLSRTGDQLDTTPYLARAGSPYTTLMTWPFSMSKAIQDRYRVLVYVYPTWVSTCLMLIQVSCQAFVLCSVWMQARGQDFSLMFVFRVMGRQIAWRTSTISHAGASVFPHPLCFVFRLREAATGTLDKSHSLESMPSIPW